MSTTLCPHMWDVRQQISWHHLSYDIIVAINSCSLTTHSPSIFSCMKLIRLKCSLSETEKYALLKTLLWQKTYWPSVDTGDSFQKMLNTDLYPECFAISINHLSLLYGGLERSMCCRFRFTCCNNKKNNNRNACRGHLKVTNMFRYDCFLWPMMILIIKSAKISISGKWAKM